MAGQCSGTINIVTSLPPVMGDVDGDGVVTQNDALLVAQYVVGAITLTPAQLARADVDCDGVVDIGDAMLIAQYAAGRITSFPCGGT